MADTRILDIVIQGRDEASPALSKIARSTQEAGDTAKSSSGSFSSLWAAVGLGNIAANLVQTGFQDATTAIKGFFTAAGELEQTNMSYQSLLGNVGEANKLFSTLTQYANNTPFTSLQINSAAKELLSFGQTGDQVVATVKQLGDVAAAGGGDLQSMSLVSGQIFAQGAMHAQDMYQVINDGGAGLIKVMAQNAGGMQKLTAEFQAGGVPAKQYFDAINDATAQGGFAFQGAQKQASTFNGMLSTLQDSATQFGEKLIGVHIDPQLGLVIEKGGLFDMAKGIIGGLTVAFGDLGLTASSWIPNFFSGIKNLYTILSSALGPSISALWREIETQLIPTLTRFWKEVIVPLLPVIGTLLVGALMAVVVALTDILKIATPVMNFLMDHKTTVEIFAGAFLALRGAMEFSAAFQAITAGYEVLCMQTIPIAMGKITAFRLLVTSPLVMTGIAIAGALADIGLVMSAVQSVRNAIDAMNSAKATIAANDAEVQKMNTHYLSQYNSMASTPAQKASAKTYLHNTHFPGFASGTFSAPGGMALVGEKGPELINLPQGTSVKTAQETQQIMQRSAASVSASTTSSASHVTLNVNIGVYAGTQTEKQKIATEMWQSLMQVARSHNLAGNVPNLGIRPI